jgi:hypothetical protein
MTMLPAEISIILKICSTNHDPHVQATTSVHKYLDFNFDSVKCATLILIVRLFLYAVELACNAAWVPKNAPNSQGVCYLEITLLHAE